MNISLLLLIFCLSLLPLSFVLNQYDTVTTSSNSDNSVISILDSLDVTTEWLSRHVTPTTPLSSMDDKRAVISQAYLELLTWNDDYEFPEVLQ